MELGAAWQAGRSFAIVAFTVGFILMIVTLCASCVAFRPIVLRCLAWGFAFCCLMQGLVFVALSTDFCNGTYYYWSSCDLGPASFVAIVAVVVYFGTAVAMAKMPHFDADQDDIHGAMSPGRSTLDDGQEMAPARGSQHKEPNYQVSF